MKTHNENALEIMSDFLSRGSPVSLIETIIRGHKKHERVLKQHNKEVFLPLSHPPGEAQVDYGFADVLLNGELAKVALFVMTLPYSDAILIQALSVSLPPSAFFLPDRSAASVACTESFQEGHVRAFEFFGGVPNRFFVPAMKVDVCLEV